MRDIPLQLLNKVQTGLLKVLGEERYNEWVRNSKIITIDEKNAIISLEDVNNKEKFVAYYQRYLGHILQSVTNKNIKVILNTNLCFFPKNHHNECSQQQMSFENFIVGKCNESAYKAAKCFANSSNSRFKLLIITGPQGVGKTHLLKSIHNMLPKQTTSLYITFESLMKQMLYALENNKLQILHHKYLLIKVLLIDDIYIPSGNHKLQEKNILDFLNLLMSGDRKIVITCEKCLRDMNKFSNKLINFFKSHGEEVKLTKPDYNTRLKFLKFYCKRYLSDRLIDEIAKNVYPNFNDLLMCADKIMKLPQKNMALAKKVIDEFSQECNKKVTLEDIARITARNFNIKISDVLSRKKTDIITNAQNVCLYLSRKYTNESLKKIGAYFGMKNHSTVISRCKNIGYKTDRGKKMSIKKIEKEIATLCT